MATSDNSTELSRSAALQKQLEYRLDMGLCNAAKVPYTVAVAIQVSAVVGLGLDPGERLNKRRLIRALLENLVDQIKTQLDLDPENAGTLIDSFECIDIQPG